MQYGISKKSNSSENKSVHIVSVTVNKWMYAYYVFDFLSLQKTVKDFQQECQERYETKRKLREKNQEAAGQYRMR